MESLSKASIMKRLSGFSKRWPHPFVDVTFTKKRRTRTKFPLNFPLNCLLNLVQFQLGPNVVLVCSRRVCGPSPLHGTIVNNVETDRSKQAFNTRVAFTLPLSIFHLHRTIVYDIVTEQSKLKVKLTWLQHLAKVWREDFSLILVRDRKWAASC